MRTYIQCRGCLRSRPLHAVAALKAPAAEKRNIGGKMNRGGQRNIGRTKAKSMSPVGQKQHGLGLCEVQHCRAFHIALGHLNRTILVLADRLQNVADVSRIAGAQFCAAFAKADLPQKLGAVVFIRDSPACHYAIENRIEYGHIAGFDVNLIVDTAKERFISQIRWVEVQKITRTSRASRTAATSRGSSLHFRISFWKSMVINCRRRGGCMVSDGSACHKAKVG